MCIRDRANILKDLIEARFAQTYNVGVELKLVQGALLQSMVAGIGPDAVSYTHLDVYKRQSLWCTLTIPENANGDYTFTITLYDRDHPETEYAACTGTVHVIPVQMPRQELIFSQWFHCDCLAEHYNVPVFSEDFWPLLERYLENAVR